MINAKMLVAPAHDVYRKQAFDIITGEEGKEGCQYMFLRPSFYIPDISLSRPSPNSPILRQ
jgi:hypothetical protein